MRTKTTTPTDISKKWFVIDADGKTLGRITTTIARMLQGKHKPYYTPNLDTGDFIVVVNADKIKVTGNKENAKYYFRHSMYPGGQTETPYLEMMAKKPTFPIEHAVKGMLPKTKMGRKMFKKLFVYAESNHPHAAQAPENLEL